MAQKFRNEAPKRTFTGHYADYHKYKVALADDFNHKCGYTHCSDFWFGGKGCFQIDHFKPKSVYPKLETEYSNLVYACSYVNRAKWDDDSSNYLDPCNVDYNLHFERTSTGEIVPLSDEAKYMYSHLNLHLKRYAIIWMLDQLHEKIDRMETIVVEHPEHQPLLNKLYGLHYKMVKYLKGINS